MKIHKKNKMLQKKVLCGELPYATILLNCKQDLSTFFRKDFI